VFGAGGSIHTGLQFDLRSAQGKLIASLMAALAEFERDLLPERVRSGIAAARKRGVVFGRRPGPRIKADRFAPRVLKLVGEGRSYREISHRLGPSKNTVLGTVKRDRAA
jgi:putative DNA-invertase from lambdoid prophage Rac